MTKCYSLVPVAILTEDVDKYKEILQKTVVDWQIDFILDTEFRYNDDKRDTAEELFELDYISNIIMGSGYNYGCMIHDGSCEKKLAKYKLSNGDWLVVWFWEWYNK